MTELFEFENRVNHNNPLWDYPFPQETILTSSYSVHLPEPSQQKYSNLSRINNAVFFLGLEQLLNSHESILATGVWKTSPEIANLFAGFGKFDLFHDERLESAINYLSIAYQINPESCSSRYYLALALEKNQQGSKALPLLDLNDHSVCSQSISAELYYLRGKLLARQGKYLQALPDLQLAGNLDPESPEKLITLSNVLMVTEGNYNEIHLLLEQAIDLSPNSIWGYVKLCELERRHTNYESALSWCKKAIQLFPEVPLGYYSTGLTYLELENPEQAINYLVTASDLSNDDSEVWNTLGDAYQLVNELDNALSAYKQSIKIDPDNSYAKRRIDSLSQQIPTQQFLHKMIRQLGKESFLYAIGTFLQRIATLLLVPIYTSGLTELEYGALETLNVFVQTLIIILNFGLSSALLRYYVECKDEDDVANMVRTSSVLVLAFSTVISLVLIPFYGSIAETFFRNVSFGVYVLLAFVWAISLLLAPVATRVKISCSRSLRSLSSVMM